MARITFSAPRPTAPSPKANYEMRLRSANIGLLLIVIMSFVNILLTLFNADVYFLFSASFPLAMAMLGMELCGKFPPEYYEGYVFEPLPDVVLYILTAIALLTVLLYLVCWFLSKKHSGAWLVVALVLFSLDTLFLLFWFGIDLSRGFDYLFHAWAIVDLARGVYAWNKWRRLPPEEAEAVAAAPAAVSADFSAAAERADTLTAEPTVAVESASDESASATPVEDDPLDAEAAFRKIGASDDTDSAAN